MSRSLAAIMLDAFAQCSPDNEWAQIAIERLRTSDQPEVTAVLIDAELEQAAAFTAGVQTAWLRSIAQGGP